MMRPASEGGMLHHKGQVEVISLAASATAAPIPYDIRMGVWVVFEATTEYIQQNCFEEYSVQTDPSGRYSCMYKRWHLIGLEVGISVASVGLRERADRLRRPAGTPTSSPPPSATSRPARCSTARAATRSTAS